MYTFSAQIPSQSSKLLYIYIYIYITLNNIILLPNNFLSRKSNRVSFILNTHMYQMLY